MNTEEKNSNPCPNYLKISEVAAQLNISKSLVYRLIKDHELKAVTFGQGAKRVRWSDLQAYIQTHFQ